MSDINTFANDLLLDFADAVHFQVARVLRHEFGDDWLVQGVRRHFNESQFARVEKMLQNPMRVVEMDQTEEELHGLEHLWNILNGNWILFEEFFRDRDRTAVYLGEIVELRHNLAHRRQRHTLLRRDLQRIVGNCRLVLAALTSRDANKFTDVLDLLSSGGSPWGASLDGHLPPSDEIYDEFVGRPTELQALADWLSSDSPQVLVWGYGGAGKSALAHKFVRDVKDGSNENLIAVGWVTAKTSEYVEGASKEKIADFDDLGSLVSAIWSTIYSEGSDQHNITHSILLHDLKEIPILLIVDDFDTVSADEALSEFLLHDLRSTLTRVIYTSRQRVPGMKNIEVPPFADPELREFVSLRSVEYGVLDSKGLVSRVNGIRSLTGGYPLFVNDLIHHAALVGIDKAMEDWTQKKGDAAREYALRRQIEYLGHGCGEVLIALSVANRALLPVEISNIAGLTDEDSQAGLRQLLQWRMVNQVSEEDSVSPMYRMNSNTSRLVKQTFKNDNRLKTFSDAFRSLTGERVPEAKKRAIGMLISATKRIERAQGFSAARKHLLDQMTGELAESPDLFGVLGWLCARQRLEAYADDARAAFNSAHQRGATKIDTYYWWTMLEKDLAEWMIDNATEGSISDDDIGNQWKECERIAELGTQRCGPSQVLCYWAGYAASREAKARERSQNFTYAQGAYSRSVGWFEMALESPTSDVSQVARGAIYRGLTLAYEGLGEGLEVQRNLSIWYSVSDTDRYIGPEIVRLVQKFPKLKDVPDLVPLIQRSSYAMGQPIPGTGLIRG